MDSRSLALIRTLDGLLIEIHNAINEGAAQKAALAAAAFNASMGRVIKGMREGKLKVSEDLLEAVEARSREFSGYLQEVTRLKEGSPPPPPEEHLYEVVIGVPGRPTEGFTVLLTSEDKAAVENRLKNPYVTYSSISDISVEGIGFDALLAKLKGEKAGSPLDAFWDPAASPYLTIISYKPAFFGLVKRDSLGGFAWLTNHEVAQVNRFVAGPLADPSISAFEMQSFSPNVSKDDLFKILTGLGL